MTPTSTILPPLPEGYTYSWKQTTRLGVRVLLLYEKRVFAEIAAETPSQPASGDRTGIRYKARRTNYTNRDALFMRPFNNPYQWIEYPDMEAMISTVLTQYRLGLWKPQTDSEHTI